MTVSRVQTPQTPGTSGPDAPAAAIAALRETLASQLDELADEATEIILAQIPAYREGGAALRGDIRTHVVSHLQISLDTFGAGRAVTREELLSGTSRRSRSTAAYQRCSSSSSCTSSRSRDTHR